MASPPYRSPAASPPYPPHATIPNPKKRPSHTAHSQLNPSKRRKPSSFSTSATSAHPLRQTSFPPEESIIGHDARSPSVDSDFTGITGRQSVGTSATAPKKPRGRKKKGQGSVKSGTPKGMVDGRSATGQAGDDGGEDEDEEDGDAGAGMVDAGGKVDKAAEKKKMAVLIDAFSSDQANRYDMYRRAKLRKETVRKITNQTLSQSVPPSVITTINGFTKVYIGTIIERAREVQQQYVAAERSLPSPGPESHTTRDTVRLGQDYYLNGNHAGSSSLDVLSRTPEMPDYLGPLLPDHLRESQRRYRRDGEGGGAGLAGLSLELGLKGAGAARLQGRRLFR